MNRVDGTAARQLDLLDDFGDFGDFGDFQDVEAPVLERRRQAAERPALRLLRRDVYAELARRRRRAQIAARHELDKH